MSCVTCCRLWPLPHERIGHGSFPDRCPSSLDQAAPGRLPWLVALIGTSAVLTTIPARADSAVSARSGSFTIRGAGWGHGWGMSQYGAYGAARKGLSWKQILTFYYPGTRLSSMPAGTKIKVWITADNDSSLRVLPASGLTVRDTAGHRYTVPDGAKYTSWRISRSGTGYRLSYRTSSGSYVTKSTGLTTGTWSFSTRSKIVKVVLPNGSVRPYRGTVALIKRGTGGRTINNVLLEDYVKGVVPAEMPTSWAANAVRAQAVAARSYAVRLQKFAGYSGYDICDTTACQVYGGMSRETSGGNAAVKATAGVIVTYRGVVALTQFASSNGGHYRPRRLPLSRCAPRSIRRSDQVSGVDPDAQREQHQPRLALGGDSEAVADHQPRRRRRLGWPSQGRSRSSEVRGPPLSRERPFSTCSACVPRSTRSPGVPPRPCRWGWDIQHVR